jgi:threonine dehydrogenase-like Zn-dependent dehydrogenase
VLAAQQLGAEQIVAFSRHEPRQKLARQFGATDIVTERGDDGVAKIKDLTNGLGAHSVIEAVGTQESMMQAVRSTRPGGSGAAETWATHLRPTAPARDARRT